jgi:hypothetical protein
MTQTSLHGYRYGSTAYLFWQVPRLPYASHRVPNSKRGPMLILTHLPTLP